MGIWPQGIPIVGILPSLSCAIVNIFVASKGDNVMPHVQITLLEGRTPEQKRKIVERITATLIEETSPSRQNVTLSFF